MGDENRDNDTSIGSSAGDSSGQNSGDTSRPKVDVSKIYPNPTTGLMATPKAPTPTNDTEPAIEIEASGSTGKIVTFIGIFIIVSSVASLLRLSVSMLQADTLAHGAKSIGANAISIILSIILINLGLGIIRRRESSRF